jgi:hypothetical protein
MENNNEMNYPTPSMQQPPVQYVVKKPVLPGSIAALILGIASLSTMAFFGWIPAIIAMKMYKKAQEAYDQNPDKYSETSHNMAQSGNKMATIGLVLGILGMFATGIYYYWIFSSFMHGMNHYNSIYY